MVEVFITFNLKEPPTWGLALFHPPSMTSKILAKNLKDARLFAFACTYKEKRRGAPPVSGPPFYSTPPPGYFSPFPHGTIHYRSSGGIQAAKWSWQIHTGFHEPRATRAILSQTRTNQFRLRGYHPLRHAFPDDSATDQHTRPLSGRRGQDSPTTPHTQPLPSITRTRFNHHPLSLATTHGISSPTGTEMFHFPASPPTPYTIQMQVTRHNSCRVPPFGNPRITARQPAPRGISQATTSFIGP